MAILPPPYLAYIKAMGVPLSPYCLSLSPKDPGLSPIIAPELPKGRRNPRQFNMVLKMKRKLYF